MENATPDDLACARALTVLLDVLGCVLTENSATYVSMPITTGRHYFERLREDTASLGSSHADLVACRLHAIERNRADSRAALRELRRAQDGPLIDPSAVDDIPGWTQADYHEFWACVIERYAAQVVFLDGWQFSRGCVHEFLIGARGRKEMLDVNRNPLTVEIGMELIRDAVEEMRSAALDTAHFEHTLRKLEDIGPRERTNVGKRSESP